MVKEVGQFKDVAREHMERDTANGGPWICGCEACRHVRSLVGMEKMLNIWPLGRELRGAEEQLKQLADGPEKQRLADRYLKLHDQLAAQVAG
jgi:hypothetical protein